MALSWYRIAGLAVQVESDSDHAVVGTLAEPFRIGKTGGDVCLRICTLAADEYVLPLMGAEEAAQLAGSFLCRSPDLQSPLLRASRVRDALERCRQHGQWVAVALSPSIVSVVDLLQHETVLYMPFDALRRRPRGLGPGMLAPHLPLFSAVLLHAAGVVRGDRAALFLGADGIGKTTVATSVEGAAILGDDMIVLRSEPAGTMVHATPWGLHADPARTARASGLFLLEQAEEFDLTRIRARTAIESLWSDHVSNRLELPRGIRTRSFDFLVNLCQQIPAYRMRFSRDRIDWAAIDAALAA
jgi:hypothetical protein